MKDYYEICFEDKYSKLVQELSNNQENIIKKWRNPTELNTLLELNNQTTVDSVVEIRPKDHQENVIQQVLEKRLPISNKEFYQETLDLFNL
jgi:hypothetical protein